jgi:MFS family permease
MLKNTGRNNQLHMLANFLFAFGTGLWLNLRPLYLADLDATSKQIGLALAISGFSAGFLLGGHSHEKGTSRPWTAPQPTRYKCRANSTRVGQTGSRG